MPTTMRCKGAIMLQLYHWHIEMYGIECFVIREGSFSAESFPAALNTLETMLQLGDWGRWEEGKIHLDDRNDLGLDPPVPCYTKETGRYMGRGKPHILTVWCDEGVG